MEPLDPHDWEADLRRYGDLRLGGVGLLRSEPRPAVLRLIGGPGLQARLEALTDRSDRRRGGPDKLAPWEPIWLRALPGRTRQEVEHARDCLRAALEADHDFLDGGLFTRRNPADADHAAACAEAAAAQAEIACTVGPSDDRKLRRRVAEALRAARGRPHFLSWMDLRGPQPVTRREWWFDGRRLLLESEAHAGLTLRGPADLVGRVTALLGL